MQIEMRTRSHIIITQPRKLERLAILKLDSWILLQAQTLIDLHARNPAKADEMLPKHIESTQNYIQRYLPGAYYDVLFREVSILLTKLYRNTDWAEHNGRWGVFGRMIETLLSNKVTALSRYNCWGIFESAFESKCEELTGVQDLDLPYYAREHLVIKLLEKAHGLRRLTIRATHTTNILKCMVQNCKLVEEVYLNDCRVSDDDIDILIELRALRIVRLIKENEVSEIGIEKLLMSCENLEILHISPFRDILEIIEGVSKLKAISGKQLKLNSYYYYSGRSLEHLQMFCRSCPFIQELNVDKSLNNIAAGQIYLEPVKALQHLRKLTLSSFDFYGDRVNEVLEANGRNLTDLNFFEVTEIDFHSLKYISVMCPRLQSYTLVDCTFTRETLVDELSNEVKISPLECVKYFTLNVCCDYVPPTFEQLYFLLTNHPRVESLDIYDTDMLQDVFMAVLDKKPESLMCLKRLLLSDYLPMLVIDRIVQNCVFPPIILKTELLPY